MTTQVSSTMLGDDARKGVIALRGPAVNGTYPVFITAPFDMDILSAAFQTDTGTINAKFTIDGTDVEFDGGDEILPMTSSSASEDADSAFSVSMGDTVLLVLSGAASSPTLAAIDLFVRRTD